MRFSEPVSSSTVSTAAIRVQEGREPISITVSFDNTADEAKLLLRQPLKDRTTYSVTVASTVQDFAGNGLPAPYSWSFRTDSPTRKAFLPLVRRASAAGW